MPTVTRLVSGHALPIGGVLLMNPLGLVRSIKASFVEITPEMLLDCLRLPEGGVVIDNRQITQTGIPEDAVALRAALTDQGNIALIFQSEKFDRVVEGARIPRVEIIYKSQAIEPVDKQSESTA